MLGDTTFVSRVKAIESEIGSNEITVEQLKGRLARIEKMEDKKGAEREWKQVRL